MKMVNDFHYKNKLAEKTEYNKTQMYHMMMLLII